MQQETKSRGGRFSTPDSINRLRELLDSETPLRKIANIFGLKHHYYLYEIISKNNLKLPEKPKPKEVRRQGAGSWRGKGKAAGNNPTNWPLANRPTISADQIVVEEIDGVKVKKCPPGYAMGAHPGGNCGWGRKMSV
ncbi:MAG: hypothetical protein ACXWYM_00155 [Candidatus Binatia bacterium]